VSNEHQVTKQEVMSLATRGVPESFRLLHVAGFSSIILHPLQRGGIQFVLMF